MTPPAAIIVVVFRLTFPFVVAADIFGVTVFCDRCSVTLSSIMVPFFCRIAGGGVGCWPIAIFLADSGRCETGGVPVDFGPVPLMLLLFVLFGGEDC